MRHDEACDVLEKLGADKDYRGRVIVPEHIPKIKDFYELEDGKDHPPPSQEFLEWPKGAGPRARRRRGGQLGRLVRAGGQEVVLDTCLTRNHARFADNTV